MFFRHILLAYQLENYNSLRFLKFIYSHPNFWLKGSQRQTLDWTAKAKLIFGLSMLFLFSDIIGIIFLAQFFSLVWYIFLPLCFIFLPIYFIVSNFLLSPLDLFLKKRIIKKAKKKLSRFSNLQIIAITGSIGKTTTKEILSTALSESFSVLKTEGNKNTPLGVSKIILDELREEHEIFIVEMGAYHRGNIAELCELVGPNISILTGITLQHLERFQSLENIIDAKFEILECLGENNFAVIDTTTEGVQKGLASKKLRVKNIAKIKRNIPYKYKENLSGIIFDLDDKKVETKLLAPYLGKTFQICYEVSKHLGQSFEEFYRGVQKIDFVEHRMQLIYNAQTNIFVLDDSYNGNLKGIEAIIELLKNAPFTGRKIVAAGGVVELGEKSDAINSQVGEQISDVADVALLVEGPVGNAIESGLRKKNFSNIKKYSSPLLLHEDIKNIVQSGDLIIFQNDLPDNYL